jgi:hypothetical protein
MKSRSGRSSVVEATRNESLRPSRGNRVPDVVPQQTGSSPNQLESATACLPRLKRGRWKSTLQSIPAHRLRRMPPAALASSHWRIGETDTRRTRQAVGPSRRRKRGLDIPIGRCRLRGRSPVRLGESPVPPDREGKADRANALLENGERGRSSEGGATSS